MKSLLFALGLALCCFVQAEWEEVTATSKKGLGRWVTVAVACNSEDHLEQIREMPAIVADLSRPEKDIFSITAYIPMPDGCKEVTYQFRKKEDGKYHGSSGNTTVTVDSVKVQGNSVISTISVVDADNNFTITVLHSRQVTQDPEILQKFKDKCKSLGYSDDQIVVLNPTVKCP